MNTLDTITTGRLFNDLLSHQDFFSPINQPNSIDNYLKSLIKADPKEDTNNSESEETDKTKEVKRFNPYQIKDKNDFGTSAGALNMASSIQKILGEIQSVDSKTASKEIIGNTLNKVEKDLFKIFKNSGFSRDDSVIFSKEIVDAINDGINQDADFINLSLNSSSELMIEDKIRAGYQNEVNAYENTQIEAMQKITAVSIKSVRISINTNTGEIAVAQQNVKALQIKTRATIRWNDQESVLKDIGKVLDSFNNNNFNKIINKFFNNKDNKILKIDENEKDDEKFSTKDQPKTKEEQNKDFQLYAFEKMEEEKLKYLNKYKNLEILLKELEKDQENFKNIFKTIMDIRDVIKEKNDKGEDILSLTADFLSPEAISSKDETGKHAVVYEKEDDTFGKVETPSLNINA